MFKKTLWLFLLLVNLGFSQSSNDLAIANKLINKVTINKDNLSTLNFTLYTVSNINLKEQKLMYEVIEYLGTPYKYGGMTKLGIDCSAFTQTVFWLAFNETLPRTAQEQYNEGIAIDKDSLKYGDLIFFKTSRRKYVGHVGIYLDSNKFVHSGCKEGVSIASLEETYYSEHYLGAKRILK